MLQFDNRLELSAPAAGPGGGRAAPAPPRPTPRATVSRLWGAGAVDRGGFSDAISGAPLPQTGGVSFPESATPEPARVGRSPLEPEYDPLDIQFLSEGEPRDPHTRYTVPRDAGPAQALTLEEVVRSLLGLDLDYDPLDLEFLCEEELRDLHARHATGAEERPGRAGSNWAIDDVAFI